MGKLTVINDTHCGVIRSGGTTPQTAWALRLWVLERFQKLLAEIDSDLLILGDLFDSFSVPYLDLLEVHTALVQWLVEHPGCTVFLVPGNHDLPKTTATMSSFQFLCRLMRAHSNRVIVLDQPGRLRGHDGYVIPHVMNQEQFDIEVDKVPDDVSHLYLHCNFDNKFAQQLDHSLNLSAAQAQKLPVRYIVFAHEHQSRVLMQGRVVVIGNQIPTSVADCLGNDVKYKLEVNNGTNVLRPVWEAKDSFERIDWHDCMKAAAVSQFIRVEGEAAASEAAAVASIISKMRSTNKAAFVITNAVKIDGRSQDGEKQSLEKVQSYNITEALEKRLSKAQWAVVKKLMEETE